MGAVILHLLTVCPLLHRTGDVTTYCLYCLDTAWLAFHSRLFLLRKVPVLLGKCPLGGGKCQKECTLLEVINVIYVTMRIEVCV